MEKIVFLLGPSGSGKTQLARWVAEDLLFEHIDIDRWPRDGIDLEGLRKEWDEFYTSGKVADLATAICERTNKNRKEGVILSFPGTLILSNKMIEAAESKGVRVLILYGTGAECLDAFLRRERETGRRLNVDHWFSNNAGSYFEFSRPEVSKYRLIGFEQSRHRTRGDLVAEIKQRVFG